MTLTYDPPPRVSTLTDGCAGSISLGIESIVTVVREELIDHLPNLSQPHHGYVCRWINGSRGPRVGSLSVHATGRAFDAYARADRPSELRAGDALAGWLVANAEVLGTQMVIWNRRVWGGRVWGWRPVGPATHPHDDHVHFEITVDASETVTVPTVRQLPPIVETVPDYDLDVTTGFAADHPLELTATGLVPGWWTDSDGTVTAVHGAQHHGDLTGLEILPDDPIVAIVSPPAGGYWLIGADAGIFTFGGAPHPPAHRWLMNALEDAGGLAGPILGAQYIDEHLVLFASDGGQFPLPAPAST